MSLFSRAQIYLRLVVVTSLLGPVPLLHAQTFHTCKNFFTKLDYTTDCVEALFSEDPTHLTFSSMPPGNGFAVGGVLEQNAHYVSPFSLPSVTVLTSGAADLQHPDSTTKNLPSLGSLWSSDGHLAAVFSTNGSWVTTGTLTLMPKGYTPGHRMDHNDVQVSCNKVGPLCTKKILGFHFEATHRSLQTISFYGLGPTSPGTKYTFHENDTFGSVRAALPLTDWLTIESGFEYSQTYLPSTTNSNSVSLNFTDTSAPGLTTQPGFAHSHLAIITAPTLYVSRKTDDQDENHIGPLMKPYFLLNLHNSAAYNWQAARGDSSSSFQQLVLDSDEHIQLGTMVRHYVQVADVKSAVSKMFYSALSHSCGDSGIDWSTPTDHVIKVRQRCRYGDLDLRSHVVVSGTGESSTVPFYLQPTVGGSDINSQVSLRGFANYRFRDPDALFVQTEYSIPIRDPFGLLIFYDAGTVGQTFSSLSFAHLRQDAGVGATFRLQGNVVAQTYLAWGGGHGPNLNYDFSKLF